MRAMDIVSGAPAWVYALFVALVLLGMRRLRTRETPLVIAMLPSAAFLIWSIVGAVAFAERAGAMMATGAWLAGAVVGSVTGVALPDPRGERLPGGRVRQPGSWVPLILYLGVFVVRFACGAWAAIVPAHATTAIAIGITVSAAVTARLLVGIVRWRDIPAGQVVG